MRCHALNKRAVAVIFLLLAVPSHGDEPKPAYRWEKPVVWKSADGPEAREHGTFIVDEKADRAILIGGSGYNPQLSPLADVWELSLKADRWRRLKPQSPVPSGGSRRAAQVPGRGVAYLFGGYGASSWTNRELVRVDFSNDTPRFEPVPQDDPPPARCLHAFVYDPKLDQFILFGGVTIDESHREIHNDVWVMKLVGGRAKWTKLDIGGPPSPRYGFFYGYDNEEGRLIVFSGAQGFEPLDPADDTWLLSMRGESPTWKKWQGGSPRGRRNGCFVYDPDQKRLFIFGGTPDGRNSEPRLCVFEAGSGGGWIVTGTWLGAPHPRSSGFGFHDRARHRIVLGFGNGGEPFLDLYPLRY
jgi:hypothetical protein